MYQRRIKRKAEERTFYLITNRVTGGSFIFGDVEKEYLKKLLLNGQIRLGYRVWDYCIMNNHYHALIEIPKAENLTRQELLLRWQNRTRIKSDDDPGDDILEEYRDKIFDISYVVGNFQQRFTQWYNQRNNRWGKLFGGRFDSVILDENGAVARAMAYITLNPVRARMVIEPAEYRWCGYAERMAKGKLQENEIELAKVIQRELGLPDQFLVGNEKDVMKIVWKRFRQCLLGHSSKRSGVDLQTIADVLNQNNKSIKLEWSQRLMLKARFATKGVAIGSQQFVQDILNQQKTVLGYKRKHSPHQVRAWDEFYCLKRHRVWVG